MKRTILILVLVATFATNAFAHEVRPAYLELRQTGPETYDVLWKVPGQGENLRLGIYVELPAGCTNVTAPRGSMTNNAFTERWKVKCPGGLGGGTIHIAGLSGTVVDVLVRLERLDGTTQVTRLMPSDPSFVVEAMPSRWRLAATYLRLGTDHILMGVDHLLFVLGLVLIVGNRWTLFKTITAFTVAHSITLAVATLGYASAPLPPLNAAIALSILFLGPEIVRVWRGETSLTIRYPWVVAFVFGLLHGFGFASGLKATGLPQADIAWALLLFNVGVEIGQVFFVFLILAMAWSYRSLEIRWPRWALALPGYTVGTLGAYWTIQRTAILLGFVR
jgi:hydrogenase/urease accessory protein HupE